MAEIKVEKQTVVTPTMYPVQYKFTTYKTVSDINGTEVQIVDTTETRTTADLESEVTQLNSQVTAVQARITAVQAKQQLIADLVAAE